jgi:RHS repeat-associated protein
MVSKAEGTNFWRYGYDYENRLTSASTRKQTVRYRYDALGRRVQRYTDGSRENTKFIYDGQDVLVDDNAGVLTKYINGQGIDNKLRVQTGSNVNYFLADHLGSTNGLTDASGNLTASTNYDSFGNASNANFPTRYQFTGREHDNFTGLHYYRARFYDANLGRFISEDPIGLNGGINQYGYVGNNASNLIDPSGLDGCKRLPNGKCEPIPQIPMSGGEPPRTPPRFLSDPPRSTPTPFGTPTPSATPISQNGTTPTCGCTNTPYQNSFPGTFQIGLNFNFTYGIGNINASYGLAVDTSGNIATYKEGGGGGAIGAGGSGVVNFNFSNARNIDDLGGWFTNGSVGLGDGADAQINGFVSPDGNVKGGGFGLGVGAGGGVSVTETYTEIGNKYNIFSGWVCPKQ